MIEVNANENREPTRFGRLSHWVRLKFTLHEIWVLKAARRVPIFALFAFATLWPWVILPVISISILSVVFIENTGVLGDVLNTVLGVGSLLFIAPWYFRWYFVCVGLMCGGGQMALSKENEVLDRLERLESTKATSGTK